MDADADTETVSIQVLNEAQLQTELYKWYKRRASGEVGPSGYRVPCPKGANGQWFLVNDDGTYVYPDPADDDTKRVFTWGDSFLLDSFEGRTVTFNGQVTDDNMFRETELRDFINYIGNPYPAAINIQDVQMDADADTETVSIQVLNEAQLQTELYKWYKRRASGEVGPSGYRVPCPEGANGQWFLANDDGTYVYPDPADADTKKVFAAGEGFLLDTAVGRAVTILAPFDL